MSQSRWVNFYQLILDGKPAKLEICGYSKKNAYANQFEQQWYLYFPGQPIPNRKRMKFEKIDSYREN